MRPLVRTAPALLVVAAACAGAPLAKDRASDAPAARHAVDAVPPPLAPAFTRAEAAVKALHERLAARLAAALAAGGPLGAVDVCRADADEIARAVSAQTGVEVGRSGARAAAARGAPAWATRLLEESAGRRAEELRPVVLDLGAQVVVVRPIGVGAACLACHGRRERIAPEVGAAIAGSYSLDRLVGFSEGELAGVVWGVAAR